MHKHQSTTKHERKARQLLSEEALREKNTKNALARVAQEQAVTKACTVLEGVLEKEARAEKLEGNRIAMVARNPMVPCGTTNSLGVKTMVKVPFAALPKDAQRAYVCILAHRAERVTAQPPS